MSISKMSQFVVETLTNKSGRLGHLTFSGDSSFPTPAFFLHTSGGSVPHITSEVLNYIFPPGEERPPLQISIDSTITFAESVANFEQGVAKFVGLPGSCVFLSVHNPLQQLRSGKNHAKGISLWGRNGKKSIDLKDFKTLVQGFKPTFFQGLSDYDVTAESGTKRLRKSTTHNLECLEGVTGTNLIDAGLFATIESSWFLANEDEATKTVKAMLEKLGEIHGFLISGLALPLWQKDEKASGDKKETKVLSVEKVNYSLVDKIVALLPSNKPRYIPGPFNPTQILELISRGIDLFDTSFVTRLADDGQVIVMQSEENAVGVNEALPAKNEVFSSPEEEEESTIVSLKDKKYFADFSPISKTCSCYTCRKHTKSYINHLYATNELLGPVLLMIHNLTAFNQIFTTVRNAFRSDEKGISKLV